MITKNKTYTFEEIRDEFDKAKIKTLKESLDIVGKEINDPLMSLTQGMITTLTLSTLEHTLFNDEGDE